MKSTKVITGLVVGAVVALIMIPKTRKMISDAVDKITGTIKDTADKAKDMAAKGKKEVDKYADKTKDVANAVN